MVRWSIFAQMLPSTDKYVLLLGSDLGDREANLRLALANIREKIGAASETSNVHETDPWGFESNTKFLNQAVLIETALSPEKMLDKLQSIEQDMGRVRTRTGYESRIIDIDILCSDKKMFSSERLSIPHEELQTRAFALIPLCAIAGNWIHPTIGLTYSQILARLQENVLIK